MALRALTLDFKQLPRQWSVLGLILLVAGAIVLAGVLSQMQDVSGQIELAEARLVTLAKRGKIKTTQPADSQEMQQEIRQANEVLSQLSLPWDALFKAVESNSEDKIALLAIQPDAGKRLVRIGGEAKNFEALLAYIDRLEQSEELHQVFLTSHEIRQQDAEKPVRFALVANWRLQR